MVDDTGLMMNRGPEITHGAPLAAGIVGYVAPRRAAVRPSIGPMMGVLCFGQPARGFGHANQPVGVHNQPPGSPRRPAIRVHHKAFLVRLHRKKVRLVGQVPPPTLLLAG